MTKPNTPASPPIDAIVREQTAILRELCALAPRQSDAVTRRDADALDALLDHRQALIVRLSEVSSAVAARSAEIAALAAAGGPVACDLAEAGGLWAALAASDSMDMAALRSQRDELSRELGALGRTGRAAGAYAGGSGRAFFQDTEA